MHLPLWLFSFFSFSFLLPFFDGLARVFWRIFHHSFRCAGPWLDWFHWPHWQMFSLRLCFCYEILYVQKPLKTLYLRYHNACGHQTRQNGSLQWEASAHKITWPSKQMVLRDHVTNWNHYISTISVSGYQTCQDGNLPWSSIMACYERIVTCLEGLTHINLMDPLVKWSCKITWQTKAIISPLPNCYENRTWLSLRGYPWSSEALLDHVTN